MKNYVEYERNKGMKPKMDQLNYSCMQLKCAIQITVAVTGVVTCAITLATFSPITLISATAASAATAKIASFSAIVGKVGAVTQGV